jgi:hypothetical protein
MSLESLQLKNMDIPEEGVRVSVWTNKMVREAVKQDTKSDGTFGAAPVSSRNVFPVLLTPKKLCLDAYRFVFLTHPETDNAVESPVCITQTRRNFQ